MGKQRKTWSTDVKEAIVLSVLRGELGVAEAARQHGAYSGVISTQRLFRSLRAPSPVPLAFLTTDANTGLWIPFCSPVR